MELLLIRHSEPDASPGTVDPSLTENGRQLAADAAEWLADEQLAAVYSSPTRRALETAELIAGRVGAPVAQRPGLAEFGGDQEYVRVDELRRNSDPRWAAMADGDLSMFGTDTATFRTEVTDTIDSIVAAHPGGSVAVVSHAGVINAYLGGLLGIHRLLWVELDYVGICRMAASRSGVRSIVSLNEQAHGCGLSARYQRSSSHRPTLQSNTVARSTHLSGDIS
jgi:broad specificity phosphatase PhoE